MRRVTRPSSYIPGHRSTWTAKFPRRAINARWKPGSELAPTRPDWRWKSAGVKGNQEILARMDMIVAAGGGERDLNVDSNILNLEAKGNSAPGFLNERLMNDLRPTLFLAQLSNLLAGNIAIVHGVTGSSRTFMGEEAAGVDAARIALARIASGQSDIALIGGSQNGERKDLLVLYEFGEFNLKDKFVPVWARSDKAGFALGSGGAFLVIEVQVTRRGARGKTFRAPVQRRGRPRAPQAAGRDHIDAGKAVVQARQAEEQRRHHQRRDRHRAGYLRRTRLPRTASGFRCTSQRDHVRPHDGDAIPARAGACGAPLLCHAARCFRPTIPPGWRLKCPPRPPRLSSSVLVIGVAKAWRWLKQSSRWIWHSVVDTIGECILQNRSKTVNLQISFGSDIRRSSR